MPDLPDLPLQALQSLVAVAEQGSVSGAARARGLTQPSISRQIQDLERTLAAKLIERTSTGAHLTPAGATLVEEAREVLAAYARLPQSVQARRHEVAGEVQLGTVDSIGIHVLPPILAEFVRTYPLIQVKVVCQPSPALMDLLIDDELDLAVGTTQHPKLVCTRLYQDRLVLASPLATPEERVPASLRDLARHPVITFPPGLTIRGLLDAAFARVGAPFTPVMELANVEMIKAMVRAGLGYGIIPDGCTQPSELRTTTLHDLQAARTIRLMHRHEPRGTAAKTLREFLGAKLRKA